MISIKKKLFLAVLLVLIAVSLAFADAINGYSDAVLTLLPRSLTYNKADAIELTTAKTFTANYLGSTPLVFSSKINSDPDKNLGIVRFQDTLHNMYTSIANWAGYKKSKYSNSNEMFKKENCVTLRIHTSGIFVKEDDPNIVRDFSLSCFVTEANITKEGSEYTTISGFPKEVTANVMTLSDDYSTTYFKELGAGDYELYIPSTPIVSASTSLRYYPLLLRVFDLCVNLSSSADNLPSGYYKTEITIQSTEPYKNRAFTGERTNTGGNQYTIETNVATVSMSETITVWGYVGEVSSEDQPTFSFGISPSEDSFSMDLSLQDYYSVSSVNFYSVIGPYKSNTAPAANRNEKYKIYISPVSDYMTAGTYQFTKTNGSETIPYDIYLDSNGATFSSNYTTGIGGSGVGGNNVPSSSYYILPNYYLIRDNFNQQQPQYTETWGLSSVPIFLKVKEDNIQHTQGEYKSNLYFTVVVD